MEQNSASSSSPIKPLSHGEFSEESGWTEYIDDFERLREDGEDESDEEGASFMSASMVSDAGSGPEWKQRNLTGDNNNNNNHHQSMMWCGLPNMPKRLNLIKKKRAQEISCDDSLEDTASSPVNSPKITMNFKRMDINSRKADDNHEGYMGKSTTIGEHREFKMTSDMKEFNNNKNDHEAHQYCKNLEKKGLRLVPVSMIMNYVD